MCYCIYMQESYEQIMCSEDIYCRHSQSEPGMYLFPLPEGPWTEGVQPRGSKDCPYLVQSLRWQMTRRRSRRSAQCSPTTKSSTDAMSWRPW